MLFSFSFIFKKYEKFNIGREHALEENDDRKRFILYPISEETAKSLVLSNTL